MGGIPGAVGYVSFGTAEQPRAQGLPIRILELDGVGATPETIVYGRYPIERELNVVFLEKTQSVSTLLGFLLSPEARKIVAGRGFIHIKIRGTP